MKHIFFCSTGFYLHFGSDVFEIHFIFKESYFETFYLFLFTEQSIRFKERATLLNACGKRTQCYQFTKLIGNNMLFSYLQRFKNAYLNIVIKIINYLYFASSYLLFIKMLKMVFNEEVYTIISYKPI